LMVKVIREPFRYRVYPSLVSSASAAERNKISVFKLKLRICGLP
jgi:hypothetical protein